MKGQVFNSFFYFIFDFGGSETLSHIRNYLNINDKFVSEDDYPIEIWQNLVDYTCEYLNISAVRLNQMIERLLKNNEFKVFNMCPLPFSHLYLTNNGTVSPCNCLRTHKLGHINEKSLLEIWNDEPIKEFRRSMLEGTFEYCKKYMDNFQCHQTHNVLEYSSRFSYEREQKNTMLRLDLDLNGKCNLACEMCRIYLGPNGIYNEKNFWEEARTRIFPYLEEIAIMGGEPMIQQDVFKLMDEVGRVNPNCMFSITTNAQYDLNKKLISHLDKVSIESVGISLDSLDHAIYPSIRINGKLQRSLDTVDQYIKYNQKRGVERKFLIIINSLISKKTWHEVPSFFEYTRKRNIKLNLELLLEPHEQSIWNLSLEKREEILQFYLKINYDYLNSKLLNITMTILKSFPKKTQVKYLNDCNRLNKFIQNLYQIF